MEGAWFSTRYNVRCGREEALLRVVGNPAEKVVRLRAHQLQTESRREKFRKARWIR